jgi:hypothetical protein
MQRERSEMTDWQPIEAFPKRGGEPVVLVCTAEGKICSAVFVCNSETGERVWTLGISHPDYTLSAGRAYENIVMEPRFWMPLPDRPNGVRAETPPHIANAGKKEALDG